MADLKFQQINGGVTTIPLGTDIFPYVLDPLGSPVDGQTVIADIFSNPFTLVGIGKVGSLAALDIAGNGGTGYAINVDSGLSKFNNHIQFGVGSAIINTVWSIGVDNSSVMRINVPNGTGTKFSVNGITTIETRQFSPCIITQSATTSSTIASLITATAGAHTNKTASTENTDVYFDLSANLQFATGALATERSMRILPRTYSFVGASTLSLAATLSLGGAPIAGTNATISKSIVLNIEAGAVGVGTTASYGLIVNAQTGATNNYSAVFMGGAVGIGTLTPNSVSYLLEVAGTIMATTGFVCPNFTVDDTGSLVTNSGEFGSFLSVDDKLTVGGNLIIGGSNAGTSAFNILALKNTAIAPSDSVDLAQLYAVDLSAGNATLGIFVETSVVTETLTSDRTLSIKINGTTYKLLLHS